MNSGLSGPDRRRGRRPAAGQGRHDEHDGDPAHRLHRLRLRRHHADDRLPGRHPGQGHEVHPARLEPGADDGRRGHPLGPDHRQLLPVDDPAGGPPGPHL
ncbi:MAG: hypothetical protein MZV64_12635 [Ignavibacteriales bacterium]|nr:hypothetical protein [Ignavibacteriales bacterium]